MTYEEIIKTSVEYVLGRTFIFQICTFILQSFQSKLYSTILFPPFLPFPCPFISSRHVPVFCASSSHVPVSNPNPDVPDFPACLPSLPTPLFLLLPMSLLSLPPSPSSSFSAPGIATASRPRLFLHLNCFFPSPRLISSNRSSFFPLSYPP